MRDLTVRRSGAEVRTPVWFAAMDGKVYVFTAGESGKVKRVRGGVRGEWWDVAARLVTEPGLTHPRLPPVRPQRGVGPLEV